MKDEKSVVNITVNIAGVQEANQLVERLCEKNKRSQDAGRRPDFSCGIT